MRYGSVCSGIEAASVAWKPLGWKAQFFSEIEAFPSAVLDHHYPDVPNLGDMTKFQEWPDVAIDLLVGGTPCQSFSVAGLRAGLADPRGNLALTYLAIAARYRPRWVVWENVPGVFSSLSHDAPDPSPPPDPVDLELDGQEVGTVDEYDSDETHAFGTFLAGLSELGYGVAYRTLDAQFARASSLPFAVPQRRRRVFVVGHLGDWRRAAAVLFDGASLRGDSPPRRQAGQGVAPTISSRPTGGGGLGTDFDLDGGLIEDSRWPAEVAPTLNAHFGDKQGLEDQHALNGAGLFVPSVTNALTNNNGQRNEVSDMVNGLIVNQPVMPSVAASLTRGAESAGKGGYAGRRQEDDVDGTTYTLDRQAPSTAIAIQAGAVRENPESGPDGVGVRQDGASYTIEARAEVQAVAWPLTEGMGDSASRMPHEQGALVPSGWAVRRLTPVECCRLQGFPDDYLSQVHYRGKPPADGPMYKALGNSMACNVMQIVGERIQMIEDML